MKDKPNSEIDHTLVKRFHRVVSIFGLILQLEGFSIPKLKVSEGLITKEYVKDNHVIMISYFPKFRVKKVEG